MGPDRLSGERSFHDLAAVDIAMIKKFSAGLAARA